MLVEKNHIGNKWWHVDFHCHTPASKDYGKGEKQRELRNISPREYIKLYMDKCIDCIVIADHNSGDWIDSLKNAYQELNEEKADFYRPLVIFPGAEVTVNGNIHLLAIFSEDKETADINSFLGSIQYFGNRGDSDACTEKSFVKVVDEIEKRGGIAIPAHCDDAKGLFIETSGNTLEQIIQHKNIYALELRKKDYLYPQLYIDNKIKWCRVLGSDAHHPDDDGGERYHGSHFTWVKMTKPTFSELRLSLKDGNMSVKCSDEVLKNPNEFSHPIIKRIEINNAMYIGRINSFNIEFSPWLNSIVGGRGTGKSTIIEFLRTILNRRDEMPNSIRTDFEKYTEVNSGKGSDGLMLQNTELNLYFLKDEREYKASWVQENDKIEVLSKNNEEFVPTEGEIENRFPVRIYSQKQIFELARNPKALLEIIYDSHEIAYGDWIDAHRRLLSKYSTVNAKIRELRIDLDGVSDIKGELEDITNKMNILDKSDRAELLNRFSNARKSFALIESYEKHIDLTEKKYDSIIEGLKEDAETIENTSINKNEDENCDEIVSSVKTWIDTNNEMIKIFEEKIIELKLISQKWKSEKNSLKAATEYSEVEKEYYELQNILNEGGIKDINEYPELVKRKEQLVHKLTIIEKTRAEIEKLHLEKSQIYNEILQSRLSISLKSSGFIERILDTNKYVKIAIKPFEYKDEIGNQLRNIMGKEKGFDKVFGSEDEVGVIREKIYTNSEKILDNIEEIKKDFHNIYEGTDIEGYDKKFCNFFRGLPEDTLDKLDCWFPDDNVEISYISREGKSMPIGNASPGQKTATLLAFILSYGNEPLILDQPEDDLDNSLITELIVDNIREEKLKRQLIIVTHNANIVVNGDSDNVSVLHIAGGQTQLYCQDGLQNCDIRKQICNIMEGGKSAFERRYKRINIAELEGK